MMLALWVSLRATVVGPDGAVPSSFLFGRGSEKGSTGPVLVSFSKNAGKSAR